tara:strand:+ start:656 stop:1417 length:762 start_codon:yes stop_codon:yes gene_type:complete
MKKERSFRVFIIYALLLQFAILLSQQSLITQTQPVTFKDYTTRDATVQVLISFAEIGNEESTMVAYTGTGTIIANTSSFTYVLTAKHVCAPDSVQSASLYGLKPVLEVYDIDSVYHNAEIALLAESDDLCIVKYESKGYQPVANIASEPPLLDSEIHMYAAPSGFYVPSAITRFTGTYSGNASFSPFSVSAVYTIPAAGGSSGAAVINHKGEVIGVLHSTLMDFHHISLASTYTATINFIEELEHQESIIILD